MGHKIIYKKYNNELLYDLADKFSEDYINHLEDNRMINEMCKHLILGYATDYEKIKLADYFNV